MARVPSCEFRPARCNCNHVFSFFDGLKVLHKSCRCCNKMIDPLGVAMLFFGRA